MLPRYLTAIVERHGDDDKIVIVGPDDVVVTVHYGDNHPGLAQRIADMVTAELAPLRAEIVDPDTGDIR